MSKITFSVNENAFQSNRLIKIGPFQLNKLNLKKLSLEKLRKCNNVRLEIKKDCILYINSRQKIIKSRPLLGYFIYICLTSTKNVRRKNNQIYSQVMTVCVPQTEFCQGRRDLTRTLQRISSNENKVDFQIYF